MARIVIGTALSVALAATAACSGSSPSSPSASPSATATAFSATTFSTPAPSAAGLQSFTSFSHEHGDGEHHEGAGRELQLEGAIASIDAAHTSFVVRGTTVLVRPETIIRHGHTTLTFADLAVGGQVHVKGAADGTAVAAREITVQREDGEDHDDEGEAEGVVSGLAGACPALTFNIGTLKVTTSATTIFRHGECAAVVNGVHVEAKGAIQPDGSLAASRVQTGHEGDDDDD